MLFSRGRRVWLPLLRIVLTLAAARALFLIGGYFLAYAPVRRHHVESSVFIVAAVALLTLIAGRQNGTMGVTVREAPMWPLVATLVTTTFLLYAPALRIGFLSDDFVLAARATRGELVAPSHEFVRPLPLILWRLVIMTGADASVLHAFNVLLHGVNGVLTMLVARRTGAARMTAFLAGILFVVWPTQVESVAWASGVFDVLMTTCVLALCSVYLTGNRVLTVQRLTVMVLLTIAALLTKETSAAIPVLLCVISVPRWSTQRPSGAELRTLAVITAVDAAYMTWRLFLRAPVSGSQFPVLNSYTVKEWISRTFGTLAVPFTSEWIASAAVLVTVFSSVILAIAVIPALARPSSRKQALALATPLVWPVLATAPALGYLFVGPHLEGSRYLYLPMTGWAIFLAVSSEAVGVVSKSLRMAVGVCAIVGIGLSVIQTRLLLANWSAAAAQREAILLEAVQAAERETCTSAHFHGAPESYKGAYLFRNGLDEAVSMSASRSVGRKPNQRPCEFSWEASRFVRR